jgi:anti-anti-sigma factor
MNVSPVDDHLIKVTLSGRLDTPGVDQVETRFIASLVPGGKSAIVDLSQVEFITSMGIRMFVSAAKSLKSRRARLVLFGAHEQVALVFDAVALHKIIPVCADEAEALAVMRNGAA